MKVAHISLSEIPSNKANSIQVMKISQALQQIGEEVTLYIPGSGEVNWDELAALYGITTRFPIVRVGARGFLSQVTLAMAGIKKARRDQAEVVFSRTLWVAFIASISGFPVVLELHDLPTGRFGPQLYRWLLGKRRPKLVVFITAALKQLTDERIGVQARDGEYLIAPDGVDLDRYRDLPGPSEVRHQLGLTESLTAVYTGGFYAGRGIDILERLAAAFPGVQFLWIGGNPKQVAHWSEWAQRTGLNNIVLTGFVANAQVPLYQAAADVLLMPYSQKFGGSGGGDISSVSSPMKMFEYLAAGRCIVASDLPVLREVLDEGCAVFYIPDDFADLQHNFSRVLADRELRNTLGNAARVKAGDYDWKTRMDRIMISIRALM